MKRDRSIRRFAGAVSAVAKDDITAGLFRGSADTRALEPDAVRGYQDVAARRPAGQSRQDDDGHFAGAASAVARHQVLQFAARLPEHYKLDAKGGGKRILKEAFRRALPPDVLSRKKAGFPVPYASWLQGELKDLVVDTLTASNAMLRQLFEPSSIRQLLAEHAQRGAYSKEIFCLLVLELWLQKFLGRESVR